MKPLKGIMITAILAVGLSACAPKAVGPGGQSPATPQPEFPLPPQAEPEPLPEPDPAMMLEPDGLKGQTPATVQRLLGLPTLVRRDGNTQVMLFENASCVLDLTFYSSDVGAGFAVDHIAARDRKGQTVGIVDCLANLLPLDRLTDEQKLVLFRIVPVDG